MGGTVKAVLNQGIIMAKRVKKTKTTVKKPTKRKNYRKRLSTEPDAPVKSVRKNGKFAKGHSGNPNGKPKGTKNTYSIVLLTKAIAEVQKEPKNKNWLKHLIRESYTDHTLAIAILRKLMPDLKSVEDVLSVYAPSMSEEQASSIRKGLLKRFH